MIAGTHLAFAAALYLGGAAFFEYPPDPVSWGLAGAASLLPDLGLPTSRLGRTLFWASTRLERRFGHRTVTHSALALAAVALLASPLLLLRPLGFWSVVGGYWSHLWIDMLNPRGTDLFWPSPVRVVMPARQRHRLEVGGKGEMVLLSALAVACLALYPVSGLGFRVGLMWLIADFDMARDWLNIRMASRAVRAGGFFGGCAGPNVWVFLDSTRPVPEDTWTHVASTYDGATLKIFINGRLAGQRPVSGSVCMNANPLGVGAKHAPAERRTEAFFNGVMDDVRVYNRALSGTQIRALINLP